MSKRLLTLLIVFILLSLGAAAVFALRTNIREAVFIARKPELPAASPYAPPLAKDDNAIDIVSALGESESRSAAVQDGTVTKKKAAKEDVSAETSEKDTESAVNLAVPFTPQAPYANWDLPYQEACEEASLIMVNAWMSGQSPGLMSPEEADAQILKLVEWQEKRFGYYEDTNAEETAIIAREYYGYKNTKVLPVTSMEDVREQLRNGFAVILPATGRELGNPYFSGQGPLYHMLVAKGFTDDGKIITNDPGTRRGADFLYDPDVLYEAIGDYNDGVPESGEKLMIVISP